MTNELLNQLSQGLISPKEAYTQLYQDRSNQKPSKPRKAHFIKFRIIIPDERGGYSFSRFPVFIANTIICGEIVSSENEI
ncbi:MAG: hypothetical protein WC888_01515 [Candidatus Izemoplasmatales bacterium]|jgi:hypothetical protein